MNENTGTTVYDRSENGHDATLYSSPSWSSGKYGSALSFDGTTNQYARVASGIPAQGSTITVEAWVYPTVISDAGVDRNNFIYSSYYAALGNHKFNVYLSGATSAGWHTSNGSVHENAWQHLAFTYDGTNLKMYINGQLDKTVGVTGTISSVATLDIGRRPDSTSSPYLMQGKVDDVKVYNYARSAAQIAYDYNKGKPVAHYKFDEGTGTIAHNAESAANEGAAPVGWWRMDEGTGGTTADESGNGNTGTLYPQTLGTNTTTAQMWDQTGKIGPDALEFDGTDDYADSGLDISWNDTNSVSISLWVKPTNITDTNAGILGKVNPDWEWAFYQNAAGVNLVYWNTGGGHTNGMDNGWGAVLTAGQWTHLEYTWDGSTSRFYADGILKTTHVATDPSINQNRANNMMIGGHIYVWADKFFNGLIDDVRIYDYARSAEQIYNDYKNTHGTMVGDTKFVDGKVGKALEFDGTGDYATVDVDSWIRNCEYVTIAGWYYHNADTNGAPWGIMTDTGGGAGDGFWWHINYTGGNLYLRTEDNVNGESDGTGTPFVSTGNWYHLATVVGTNTFKVYKDGVLYWSWTPNNNFSWTNVNSDPAYFFIGKSYEDDTAGVNGKIDDVRLYNYARTAAQVMQDYNAGLDMHAGVQTGVADPWGGALPVAHWKLDENTGVLARDASENTNDGTLGGDGAGTDVPTWTQGKVGPCLDLDGQDDYVQISSFLGSSVSAVTIAAWFKIDTWDNSGSGIDVGSTGAGSFYLGVGTSGGNSID